MNDNDRISRREIVLVIGLVLCLALVWSKWPEVKVSSKTLEAYDLSDPRAPKWRNGIGLTITARPVGSAEELEPEFQPHRDLLDKYIAVFVNIDIQGVSYPIMVDLPYERLSLTDSSSRKYRLVNAEVAQQSADENLRRALEKFDWSIVNNTFTRQGRQEKGLLLFERQPVNADGLVLNLNVYHHPYKQLDLKFSLPPLRDGERASQR